MKCGGRGGTSGVCVVIAAVGAAALSGWSDAEEPRAGQTGEAPLAATHEHVLNFTMNRLDGTPEPLSEYQGKVILMVNVASRCGYTPQYEGLERLYRQKAGDGFVVLGFPANNFGGQEPGSSIEIADFCTSRFGVTFPMFEKISVTGADQHPLYRTLSAQPPPIGGDPKWNFTKFLIDRSGNVVARYEPKVKPDDPLLIARIDELLAKTP